MSDWEAVEATEKLLDEKIAKAVEEGDKEWAACHHLQRLCMRPWAQWHDMDHDPHTRLKALCIYIASLVLEAVFNLEVSVAEGETPLSH